MGTESEANDTPQQDILPSSLTEENMIEACFCLFQNFLRKKDAPTKCKALRGLTGIFMSQPRLMLELQQSGLIEQVMSEDASSNVRLEALQCWKEIQMVRTVAQVK